MNTLSFKAFKQVNPIILLEQYRNKQVTRPRKKHTSSYLVSILNRKDKSAYLVLVGIWAASLVLFFVFWFNPGNIVTPFRFVLNTLVLFYTFIMPAYFFFFVYKMKKVNPQLEIPADWRVAMIVTRAPAEPFDVVKQTLLGMLEQEYPHDNWLADEDPNDEIKSWCNLHGVKLISRKNIAAYHQSTWPRRTKCKEGNLAYFYDTVGYELYDFVIQLDADHVPQKQYLENMLRPFKAQNVGYVSAPSIANSNEKLSWSARGRLYAESIMHGPLQAGYSYHYAPLCIGSHYAVRTAALKQIGGLGPELAEDHSTTLMFNAYHWRGVHAIDAIASGEGPPTLNACIVQEFQWSRSLAIILVTLLPKFWTQLKLKAKIQFLFSELWYPIFGFTMLIGYLFPIIAVLQKQAWVRVSYFEFLAHSLPVVFSIFAIVYYLKMKGVLRPYNAPVFSWEAALFQIIRWPWAVYGSISGLITGFLKRTPAFKVTKKGTDIEDTINWNILNVYIVLSILPFIPLFFDSVESHEAAGYYFFLVMNMFIYLTAAFIMVWQQKQEAVKAGKLKHEQIQQTSSDYTSTYGLATKHAMDKRQ